jgi:hypothetical protein
MLSLINDVDGRVGRPVARSSLFDGAELDRQLQQTLPFFMSSAILWMMSKGGVKARTMWSFGRWQTGSHNMETRKTKVSFHHAVDR